MNFPKICKDLSEVAIWRIAGRIPGGILKKVDFFEGRFAKLTEKIREGFFLFLFE